MQQIALDGLVLVGKRPGRSAYVFDEVEGWYSLPDSKTDFEERPNEHGSFQPGPDLRTSAAITVRGWYNGVDRLDALRAKSVLNAVGGQGALVAMKVTDELGDFIRMVSVRKVDITDDRRGRQQTFPYAIDLLAPDPRRYGPTQTRTTRLEENPADNLVRNPSFTTTATGWSATVDSNPAAVTRVLNTGRFGFGHGRVTMSGPSARVLVQTVVPLRATSARTALVYVRPSRQRPLSLTVAYTDGTEVLQTIVMESPITVAAGAWQKLSLVDVPPPAGATSLTITVDSLDGPAWVNGETLDIDGARFGTEDEFFDGDSFGWRWEGTSGSSVSVSREFFTVTNPGTAATEPRFTIVGEMAQGFVIAEAETNRRLSFTKPILGATTVTTVDPAEGVVLVNGVPVWGLNKFEWPLAPAGSTRSYLLQPPGPRAVRTMTVELAPAWW